VALALVLFAPRLAATLAGAALRSEARSHRAAVTWSTLAWRPPLAFQITSLGLTDAHGHAIAAAESLRVALDPWSLLTLHPRVSAITIAHARFRWRTGAPADADTLDPERETRTHAGRSADRSEHVRDAARAVVRTLLVPARRLPRLELRDVEGFGREESLVRVRIDWLSLSGAGGPARLAAAGTLVAARIAGKALGVIALAPAAALPLRKASLLALALTPMSGVAITLLLDTARLYPHFGPALSAIVVSAIAMMELLGPLLAHFALMRAGETAPEEG